MSSQPNLELPAWLTAATGYRRNGWNDTIPLPTGLKYPPPAGHTGYQGEPVTNQHLAAWATNPTYGNLGLRLPPGIIGIDVDAYGDKNGAATLADCERAWGKLPTTWRTTSRWPDDGISGIRLYQAPPGLIWENPGPGIDTIHHGWRYAVTWPSRHETGRIYCWINEDTYEVHADTIPCTPTDLPHLPQTWINNLTKGTHTPRPRGEAGQIPTEWDTNPPCDRIATIAATAAHQLDHPDETDGSRHDTTLAHILHAIGLAARGHGGISYAIDAIRVHWMRNIAPDRGSKTAELEYERMITGAVAIINGQPPEPEYCSGETCNHDTLRPLTDELATAIDTWLTTKPTPPTLASITTTTPSATVAADDELEAIDHTSWWPRNLTAVLDGHDPEPDPQHLARQDGHRLFYPGKVNGLIGESESGKTWVALLAVLQALQIRQPTMYLDFEDTAAGIISRLKLMGATDRDLRHLTYISPDENLHLAAEADLAETITLTQPELIIIDGFNAAMTLMGLDINSNTDATLFSQKLLKPLSRTGAAVIYIDHVPKNKEARGKGGIGAQAKRAMTTGCAIAVDIVDPFGRGMTGRLRLTVDKDRPGRVRENSAGARNAGTAVLTSHEEAITIHIEPPDLRPAAERRDRPTYYMELISAFLEASEDYEVSLSAIRAGVGKDKKYVDKALEVLVSEGWVARSTGPNRTKLHRVITPYSRAVDSLEDTA